MTIGLGGGSDVATALHYEAKKNNLVGERYQYSAMEILNKEWFYITPKKSLYDNLLTEAY